MGKQVPAGEELISMTLIKHHQSKRFEAAVDGDAAYCVRSVEAEGSKTKDCGEVSVLQYAGLGIGSFGRFRVNHWGYAA